MKTSIAILGMGLGLLIAGRAVAADLPGGPGDGYGPEAGAARPRAYGPGPRPHVYGPPGYVGRPYFAEASRFDVYGYPVVPMAPNPLYASTGCPPLLQPVYDAVGNFAGYSPVQGCR